MSESESKQNPPSSAPKEPMVDWNVYRLVFEVGYTVAIPLVLLALGGRYLDGQFGTKPWLMLAGILLSMFVSSFLIYRKVKDIIK